MFDIDNLYRAAAGDEGQPREDSRALRVPIKRAGPYQVRFAVRDRASGKYGTAGEFLDLPDVPHGVFALSGIVLRSQDDPAKKGALARATQQMDFEVR